MLIAETITQSTRETTAQIYQYNIQLNSILSHHFTENTDFT